MIWWTGGGGELIGERGSGVLVAECKVVAV
jgi:hypothetical protein